METKLAIARKAKRLSQKKLADLANLHHRTIQEWELGSFGDARIKNVKRVADVLECKIDDLL